MGDIFHGLSIFVLPSGLGVKRLGFFETQIEKNRGNVVKSVNDFNLITHVIIDEVVANDRAKCLTAIKSTKLNINYDVLYVGTKWLSKCLTCKKLVDTSDYEVEWIKSEIRHLKCGSGSVNVGKRKSLPNISTVEARVEDTVDEDTCLKKLRKEDFLNPQPSTSGQNTVVKKNEIIIAQLKKLADAFKARNDTWRAYGYEKAISSISRYNKEITSFQEAVNISGIGEKMALKVMEIVESGTLQKVNEICNNERAQILDLFTKVWGVGPSTAESWYCSGYRTLDDLRTKANLTKQQSIGLKYFDEIQERMSREEVECIGEVIKETVLKITKSLQAVLVGSYRRGKRTCGDVDVMIINASHLKPSEILNSILETLKLSEFVTDDLTTVEEAGSQRKYMGMCKLPGPEAKHRRIDLFVVPQSEYATALMHYTGSALFNRWIRIHAASKNMSLSEHALSIDVIRKGSDIINEGTVVSTPTEESIFQHLGLDYKTPEERDQ